MRPNALELQTALQRIVDAINEAGPLPGWNATEIGKLANTLTKIENMIKKLEKEAR